MSFPVTRLRRMRQTDSLRSLVRETRLTPTNFIYPLFVCPESKDEVATGAWADDGIVQRATRAIKREVRDLVVIGDVCLCEYMSHGHCGIVQTRNVAGGNSAATSKRGTGNGGRSAVATQTAAEVEYEILNDPTL